ncbi:hypothetical protein ACVILK_005518 [Bradyrhizobium embrapense]
MFTVGAVLLIFLILWYGSRANEQDRPEYDRAPNDTRMLALHSRQDIKLVVFLLGGIIVMLGIIADRIK